MLVSGCILALYFWSFFAQSNNLALIFLIPDYSAIAAGSVFLLGLLSYLFVPKRYAFVGSLGGYYIMTAMVLFLLFETGFLISPFIAFWMLLVIFAPLFGWYGAGMVLFAIAAYLAQTILHATFSYSDIGTILLTSGVPLAIGWLAWQHRTQSADEENQSYHELASKLSSVSGQSEVVIAAITDGVIAIDHTSKITLINPAATRIIGWGKEDAIGLDYHSVLKLHDGRDQPITDLQDPVQQALTTGKEFSTEKLTISTADSGKQLQASLTASPIGGGGAIIVFRDITVERAEGRQQAEFISTASHEMRTPVASIEGYLGLALNPATAQIDDKARDFITKAHESAQHLGRLFQDLLDVSKADDGRMQNNPKVVDVVPFVHDITLGLLPNAHEKSLFIDFKPNPDLEAPKPVGAIGFSSIGHDDSRTISPAFFVNVDNDHLREVVANLIENAIKYTLKGNVTIDITGDNDHVIISIADSGIGIPKEDIPHLFQKFYRVDNSDTREIGGTGLGLYLCRRLTEAMGGKIWVESIYKEGSTFYVQLPRIDSVEAQHLIEQAAPEVEPEVSRVVRQPLPVPAGPITSSAPIQPVAPVAPIAPSSTPVQIPVLSAPVVPSAPAPAPMEPRTNIPLASIEQNPQLYTRGPSVSVPPRPGDLSR